MLLFASICSIIICNKHDKFNCVSCCVCAFHFNFNIFFVNLQYKFISIQCGESVTCKCIKRACKWKNINVGHAMHGVWIQNCSKRGFAHTQCIVYSMILYAVNFSYNSCFKFSQITSILNEWMKCSRATRILYISTILCCIMVHYSVMKNATSRKYSSNLYLLREGPI